MTDIAIGVSQAAGKAISEVPSSGADSQFAKLMEGNKVDVSQDVMKMFGMSPIEQSTPVKSVSAEGLEIQRASLLEGSEIRSTSKAAEFLNMANVSALRLEEMGNLMTSNRRFTPQELLSMQAGLGQMVLELEMCGKCCEQGSGSMKTLIQQQVA